MKLSSWSSPQTRDYTNRLAMATFWRKFHHDGKFRPAAREWGVHVHPLSICLPPRHELHLHRPLHPLTSKTSERILPVRSTMPLSPSLWSSLFSSTKYLNFFRGIFFITILHLQPLRFYCVGGSFDRTRMWAHSEIVYVCYMFVFIMYVYNYYVIRQIFPSLVSSWFSSPSNTSANSITRIL
jgi:hypothetical protein